MSDENVEKEEILKEIQAFSTRNENKTIICY